MSQPTAERRPDALPILVLAGTAELVLLAALGWWDGATFPWVGTVLYAAAFAAYAFVASRILDSDGGHVTIWVFAILMRVVLVPLAPELSEDVYRYLWDGEVQLAGINPYRFPPNSGELAEVQSVYRSTLAATGLASPYPPLAQVSFLAIAAAGGALFQAKLLWLGLDLATGWLLGRISVITGRSRRLSQLLYLWSPLLLVEVAWHANLAPLGLFLLALVALLGRAPVSAGASAGLAGATGFAPLAAVPPIANRLGVKFGVGAIVALVAVSAPYAGAWREYAATVMAWTRFWDGSRGAYELVLATFPFGRVPLIAIGVLLLGVMGWCVFQRYRPERALLWMIGACIILAPGFRPSYALWILPMAALRANTSWLAFTGLAVFGYAGITHFEGTLVNTDPAWARLALWTPLFALLVRDAVKLWNERVPPAKFLSDEW